VMVSDATRAKETRKKLRMVLRLDCT
jgi:hypothetical protein